MFLIPGENRSGSLWRIDCISQKKTLASSDSAKHTTRTCGIENTCKYKGAKKKKIMYITVFYIVNLFTCLYVSLFTQNSVPFFSFGSK